MVRVTTFSVDCIVRSPFCMAMSFLKGETKRRHAPQNVFVLLSVFSIPGASDDEKHRRWSVKAAAVPSSPPRLSTTHILPSR